MAVVEHLKKVVREEDLKALTLERFGELGVELDGELGVDGYSLLHWASHHGKAEVRKNVDTTWAVMGLGLL